MAESSLKGHFGGPVIMDRREKERESENEREKDRDNAKEINKERETPKDSADHKASSLAGEMCSWNKPISELDLSDCQRCTPSYRLLPKNVKYFLSFPILAFSFLIIPPQPLLILRLLFTFIGSIHYLHQPTGQKLVMQCSMIYGCQ